MHIVGYEIEEEPYIFEVRLPAKDPEQCLTDSQAVISTFNVSTPPAQPAEGTESNESGEGAEEVEESPESEASESNIGSVSVTSGENQEE
jgi:hypothetical protein